MQLGWISIYAGGAGSQSQNIKYHKSSFIWHSLNNKTTEMENSLLVARLGMVGEQGSGYNP